MSMKHFMNKYIKFIIIAALLVCGANTLQADSNPKTNKVATSKREADKTPALESEKEDARERRFRIIY